MIFLMASIGLGALISCSVYDEERITDTYADASLFDAYSNGSGDGGYQGGKGGSGGVDDRSGMGGGAGGGAAGGRSGVGNGGTGGEGGGGYQGGNGGRGGVDGNAGSGGAAGGETGDVCGDGKVTGAEKCDTAIGEGNSGFCPTGCSPLNSCVNRVLQGSGCLAECAEVQRACLSDDECCPPGCTQANDNDCQAYCGDGIVQTGNNETCEPPGTALDGGSVSPELICPTQCTDDGDPCTAETLSGSASTCNAVCTRSAVTSPVNGDGCCPAGANANTDSDCQPSCGNGVQESGEECEGSIAAGCDGNCKVLTTEQLNCTTSFTDLTDECRICMCTKCTNQMVACLASGDADRDGHCRTVVYCGFEKGCTGNICYCGGTNPNGTCFAANGNGPPDAPCVNEIVDAAGTSDTYQIFLQNNNSNTALGRGHNVTDCHMQNCLDAC